MFHEAPLRCMTPAGGAAPICRSSVRGVYHLTRVLLALYEIWQEAVASCNERPIFSKPHPAVGALHGDWHA